MPLLPLLQSQSAPPPAPTVRRPLGPGWAIDFAAEAKAARKLQRRKIEDRAELRRMIERAVLGIEEAPASPVVAQAEKLIAPFRRADDTVNAAAMALKIETARELLRLYVQIARAAAEVQQRAIEDEEEAAMLLLVS